ncbi:uncharacterized protein LOC107790522 isoform X1 [Nicotiana tabacum]|uniref:Uncharacterized protein LOC107790522 isoform X1 n=1 Tax=Nicotiana tabacum TaxID=4097 RepID=A0A1S3ZUD3_TOBAC|nr:uncharacterized protein LOC104107555 isoform X1 [Nicotiana tomentosiformis]XP_016467939.1 PREDICTED: uncharacterized protein LOC107790522 isoform X1 [Nicotiana tabacum]
MGRLKLNSDPNLSLKHFSHPHELELCTQLQNPTPCSGCKLPPLAQMYMCKPCNFTLHLSCTQFPEQISHPSHPDHPLALLPTSKYPGGLFNCDACNHRGDGFSYHCSDCEYDLHVICASRPLKITHQLHQCQLELTFKNPYTDAKGFSCDVCHKIGVKQWLYRCSSCDFDVHLDCSTSASISAVQGPTILQHHHSFPGATSSHNQFQQAPMAAQMRPNQFMHSASTGATGNQSPQTPIFTGHVLQNQNMQVSLGTGQARPNPLFHSASTGSIPQHQSLQPPRIQGQVRPNQYMLSPGTNNDLMNAAVQGRAEGAAQQVGQTIMQGIIGGDNNSDGNEGASTLGSIFGDLSQK